MNSKNKNTLYIAPVGYWGGVERFLATVWSEHKKNNYIFHALYLNKGPFYSWAKENFTHVDALPFQFRLRNPFQLLRAFFSIRNYVKENKIEIVHVGMPYSQLVVYFALLGLNIKLIWYQHGPVGTWLDILASALTKADLVLVNSDFTEMRHRHLPLGHTFKVRKFLYPVSLPSLVSEVPKEEVFTFCLAGRICTWKGHETVLRAVNEIKEKKFHLLIAGSTNSAEDRAFEKNLHSYVEENNLSKKLTFLGHVDNIQDIYAKSHCLIHASSTPEPFGLVVAEAMLMKLPVIASDCGGVSEVAIADRTSWVFDSVEYNHEDLADQMLKAINQHDTYIDNAYEHVTKYHDAAENTKQLECLYHSL